MALARICKSYEVFQAGVLVPMPEHRQATNLASPAELSGGAVALICAMSQEKMSPSDKIPRQNAEMTERMSTEAISYCYFAYADLAQLVSAQKVCRSM